MVPLIVFSLLTPVMINARPLLEIPAHGEIPRFFMMANGLYRGGQPTERGFQLLKEKGIKTVINLRIENDESNLVQRLGMNYVHIPVEDIQPWTQIPEAAIAKYFELVNNPANYPIFFHCHRGADRTGAMAALYRIALQGWDVKKAYSEALNTACACGIRALKRSSTTSIPRPEPNSNPQFRPDSTSFFRLGGNLAGDDVTSQDAA